MMKKNGFTLAEVLITLAIIGVVATLTLPALMTNTAEQQAKTALKKGINTLTEAGQMHAAISGFDYGSITQDSSGNDGLTPTAQSLYGLLATRTSMDFENSGAGANILTSHQGSKANLNLGSNYTIFFRDGAAVIFPTEAPGASATRVMDDGLPYGISVIYDTNGKKGPNIVSNCNGKALGVPKDTSNDDFNGQCTNQNRVVKDQFGLRLRGSHVYPNGDAAKWAFFN